MEKKKTKRIAKSGLEVILSWTAAERIWHPKTQRWFLTSAAVILFFIFIMVRIEWYIGIVAMVCFMIMWFIQGYLEPIELEHKITNKGIYTNSRLFSWSDITYFWFAEKEEQLILHIDFPQEKTQPRLTLLVPDDLEFEVFNVLIDRVKYGDPQEIEYMFFSSFIYGKYVPVSRYILDVDQPEE